VLKCEFWKELSNFNFYKKTSNLLIFLLFSFVFFLGTFSYSANNKLRKKNEELEQENEELKKKPLSLEFSNDKEKCDKHQKNNLPNL
jgi:cell division protein FtsB